ncbi:MAG: hypothetical protein RIF33_25930 [Cyclobacteriaceae bacterium]
MKSILLSILLITAFNLAYATVLIVDQNGNAPSGTFSSFTIAHNTANTGDTILVIPSSSSYGSLTISKGITVIGPGFNPQSTNGQTAKVSDIRLNTGANGCKIIGLEIPLFYLGYSASSLNNIVIENNLIGYLTNNSISSLSNVFIRQNVFNTGTTGASSITLTVSTQNNITVSNNVFARGDNGTHASIYSTTGGLLIEHNLFLGTGASNSKVFRELNNSEVRNNIFYGRNPVSTSLTNVQLFNNLTFGSSTTDLGDDNGSGIGNLGFGMNVTGDNNISNDDPEFEGTITINSSLTSWDFTYDATLGTNSPALGVAKDGSSDLGIYGGSSPFKNTGSVVPMVQTLDLPTTIQQGTNTSADIVVSGN